MTLDECDLVDEIFSHVDPDGTLYHFNATKIFDWAIDHLDEVKCGKMALDASMIDHVLKNKGIEEWKVERLTEPYASLPVLGVEMDPGDSSTGKTLTIDGNHRIVRNWRDGKTEVMIVVVPFGKWDRFLVEDIPEFMNEMVRRELKNGEHRPS